MKVSSIVLSAVLFASVQQSSASMSVAPQPEIFRQDMVLTKTLDANCQKTFSGFELFQSSDVDFSVSKTRFETRPMWPLICSMAATALETKVITEKYGFRVSYTLRDGKVMLFDFVSTDENAFQIAAFNENMMDNYNSQSALLEMMMATYDKAMGN